jgi:hypothetical protein
VEDLISESTGVRTPGQALQRELRHIATDLVEVKRGPIPTKVLELVRSFYDELERTKPKDFNELERNAEGLCVAVEQRIEEIKVAGPA